MPSIKNEQMNKTSTGDLQGGIRSNPQRLEPGGDQDCITNLILKGLVGNLGVLYQIFCSKGTWFGNGA